MQRILLVCRISESVGIGHLSRIVRVAKALKANNFIELRIVVIGANIQRDYLLDFDHKFYTDSFSIEEAMIIEVGNYQPTTIVFDLYSDNINYSKLLHAFKQKNIKLVAIDGFIEYCQLLDLIWIPSFRSPEFNNECIDRLRFGWDRFLLGRRNKISQWHQGKEILVLTGGSDPTGLNKHLPELIDSQISGYVINWVQGPFANNPSIENLTNNIFNVIKSPQELDDLICSANYILTVYGVSFFESCQYGKPISVFSPYKERDNMELQQVNKAGIALTAFSIMEAVINLKYLLNNKKMSKKIALKACNKVKDGTHVLANEICNFSSK